MSIVLLLQMVGVWDILGRGDEGGQGLDIILLYFALLGLQFLYLGD